MSQPVVAIVGSVDESREYDPPLADPAAARRACVELGQQLATSQWDLMVYSANKGFVEADVVRGYVSSGKANPGSVHVLAPLGKSSFPEFGDHPELFDVRPDVGADWEVAFFRSLFVCDGLIVLGGGRTTLVAGVVGLARRLPLVALAAFGGSARRVWERLSGETGIPEADLAAMGRTWSTRSAQDVVHILSEQRDRHIADSRAVARREDTEARRAQTSLTVAVLLLALAIGGLVLSWSWRPGSGVSIALLALVPAFAAAGGALIRTSLDVGRDWTRAAVLGAAAGLITGLLYVASQLVGAPDLLDSGGTDTVGRLLFFVLPIGFVAGLTFDAVYAKLRAADVSQAATLDTS